MSSRCGDIDAGLVLALCESTKRSIASVREMLNKESGLLALSELSVDMRTLLASKDPVAEVGRPAGPSVARPPAPMTAKELVAEVGRSAGPSVARPPAPSTSKELVAEVGAWVVLEEVNSGERTKKLLVRENGGLE